MGLCLQDEGEGSAARPSPVPRVTGHSLCPLQAHFSAEAGTAASTPTARGRGPGCAAASLWGRPHPKSPSWGLLREVAVPGCCLPPGEEAEKADSGIAFK